MQRMPYNPITKAELPRQESHALMVIGHLAIDTIINPSFEIASSPGGSAAAIATGAVQLGIKTSICSKVGKDYPKEWLRVLEVLGIGLFNLEYAEKEESLHVKIQYDEEGVKQRIECNDRVKDELSIESLPRTDHVHICPLQPENQAELVQDLKDQSKALSLSFSEFFADDYGKKDFFEMMSWKDVNIVFLNEIEAKAMTREKSPEKMALKFYDSGIGIVVITLGKKGSLVYDGEDVHRINARDVKVVDPTGCGDSYIGGFLGNYLASKDVRKAAGMGTYLASLTAQKKGAWAALLSDVGVRF